MKTTDAPQHSTHDSPAGPAGHVPVLLANAMAWLSPSPGAFVIDGTFGGGGYSRALLAAGACVLAIDRDPAVANAAAELARAYPERFSFVVGNFRDLLAHAARENTAKRPVYAIVLDIGVSSMQLDDARRGFSFRRPGPLDMRMERTGTTAADVVNTFTQDALRQIISLYGEERRAGAIAAAIVAARRQKAFENTGELAEVITGVSPRRHGKIHPATRTFQALRIFINRELHCLAQALLAAERLLCAGGRLVVITFHSLEDRIVKRFINTRSTAPAISRHEPAGRDFAPSFRRLSRQPMTASAAEIEANPRARSARLRCAERTHAPALDRGLEGLGLPRLTAL